MAQIRVALDIDVEKGDTEAIMRAVFEERASIANFIKDVIIPSTESGDGAKVAALAGGSHVHDVSEGFCMMCDKYSRKQILIPIES